ncbi:MAG: 2-oxoacid:ferredoxin oxidoreductase subunit beta [Candidatus Gastranaerophilales bacterium]|nr:2-oxoacid:ferredoxin oxidoreductase subunit beta [Candidatus Gastranaerophilales bacterium]
MKQMEANDYKGRVKPSWCPGCGNHAVLTALKKSMAELNYQTNETAIVSGIGCSSRFPFFMSTYGFHTIHGRALPVAIGLKQANPDINVIVVGGDGDGLSIGGNHFIHAGRKNPNITYIMMDNEIYALTKGQCSPTSRIGTITKCNPYAWTADRINPVLMALSFNASYVARGYSGDIKQLEKIVKAGLEHKGFAFIHIVSPCVQYNKISSFEKIKELVRELPEEHDVTDRVNAMKYAFAPDGLYTGIFYKTERPTYEERYKEVISIARQNLPDNFSVKDVIKQFQ